MIKTIIRRTGYAFAALLTFGIVVACTNGTSPAGHEQPHRFVDRVDLADIEQCFADVDAHLKLRKHVNGETVGYVLNIDAEGNLSRSHIINEFGYKQDLTGDCQTVFLDGVRIY